MSLDSEIRAFVSFSSSKILEMIPFEDASSFDKKFYDIFTSKTWESEPVFFSMSCS